MNAHEVNPASADAPKCPQCGTPLPVGALAGLCPACLLKQGAAEETASAGAHPFQPPSISEIAVLFPQLEILELIGKGGMGAVYKARQKELDRIVALKILPPGIGNEPAFAERFAREAKALAKLNHPGIVTLYEFGRVGPASGSQPAPLNSQLPLYYFLMEFVDGVNLRQLLQVGRVSPREALAIVPQICDALQYAHDQGIVHRDIKPENILLDRRGRVKVADFGLAKLVGTEGGAGSPLPAESGGEASVGAHGVARPTNALTAAGKVMGTPQYMAPEQVEHPAEVDHRADIYALGVVFYQMLTGELPGKKLEPPSKKVQVDVRLDEVVLRALEKKPELRYQQASVFKTQVETIASTPGSGQREETQTSGLHWNFWGVVGSALGSCLWMPAAAITSGWSGAGVALSDLTAAGVLIAALAIWSTRHRLTPFQGFMLLLGAVLVASATFLLGAHWMGLSVRSSWPDGEMLSPMTFLWTLLLFPALAIWFWFMHKTVRVQSGLASEAKTTSQSLPTPAPASESCFSPTALFGAVLGITFCLTGLPFVLKMVNGPPFPGIFMILLGACCMTLCGWIAISQIRRSAGRLSGMWLAVWDGTLFPLLAFNGAFLWVAQYAFGNLESAYRKTSEHQPFNFAALFWVLAALLIAANIGTISYIWRAVNRPIGGVPLGESNKGRHDEQTGNPKNHTGLGKWAFGLFLLGTIGVFLLAAIFPQVNKAPEAALVFGAFNLLLALVLGIMGWRERLAKFAVFAAGIVLAIATVFMFAILPAREKSLATEMGAKMEQERKSAIERQLNRRGTERTFGPITERTLTSVFGGRTNLQFFDFETGQFHQPPPDLFKELQSAVGEAATGTVRRRSHALYEWLDKSGVDVVAGNLISETELWFLDRSYAGHRTPPLSGSFDAIAPEQIFLTPTPPMGIYDAFQLHRAPLQRWHYDDKADIIEFRTREGNSGILEVIGLTENPRGVKVRYKLVQDRSLSTPSNAETTSAPDYKQAVANLNVLERFGDSWEKAMKSGDRAATLNAAGLFLEQLQLLNSSLRGTGLEIPTNVVALYTKSYEALKSGDMASARTFHAAGMDAGDAFEQTVPGGSYGDRLLELAGFSSLSDEPRTGGSTNAETASTDLPSATLQFRLVAPDNTSEPVDVLPAADEKQGRKEYRLSRRVLLDGSAVARAGIDFDPMNNSRIVLAQLSSDGARRFEEITRTNLHQQIAIVYQGKVLSAPVILTPIPGGDVPISGMFSPQQANEIVDNLNGAKISTDEAWAFGPVEERTILALVPPAFDASGKFSGTISPDRGWLDLDTGNVVTNTSRNWETRAGHDWISTNGFDLVAVVSSVHLPVLMGFDMIVVPAPTNEWETGAVGDVIQNWSLTEREPEQEQIFGAAPGTSNTYIFQTREGGKGILQVLGVGDNERSVRIRYKLVRPSVPQNEDRTVTGIVTDANGKPLGNMVRWRVSGIEEWRDGRWGFVIYTGISPWNFTDAAGRFALTFHGRQRLDLQFDGGDGGELAPAHLAPTFLYEVSPDTTNLNVVMKPGIPVHGTVVSPNSNRIPGNLRVELLLPSRGVWYQQETFTDADGHFTFFVGPPPTEPNKAQPAQWQISCAGNVMPFDVTTEKSVSMRLFVDARTEIIGSTNDPSAK